MKAAGLALLLLLAGAVSAQEEARRAAGQLGLSFDPSRPMQIEADEFEATRGEQGGDVITFHRNVLATQEELRLQCDWLEAQYAPGGGNPERIIARGSVRMSQDDTRVSCAELVYESDSCRVLCTGERVRAQITRGQDVMRGREIEMNLCKGTLRVRGSASIELRPEPGGGPLEVGE